jgi:hypothetical protein
MTHRFRILSAVALLTLGVAEEQFDLSLSRDNLLEQAEEIRPVPIYQYPHHLFGVFLGFYHLGWVQLPQVASAAGEVAGLE